MARNKRRKGSLQAFRKELKENFCAQQCMNWDGILSNLIEVKYGVRQDSILGPILLISHMGDMSDKHDKMCDISL
jgi:hypothetical protein